MIDDYRRPGTKAITVKTLQRMKKDNERFTVLTAYDASFASLLDSAGVEVILVGDSLGMVVQGRRSTVPVTMDDMVYHSRIVSCGCNRALLMVDMPFLSYTNVELALRNAARLMQEGNAQVLKLEGSGEIEHTVRQLSRNGVPVCIHLGLLPQSINKLGHYGVQGRKQESAQQIIDDALRFQDAGSDLLLIECVPQELGEALSKKLDIPVIGIGAGPGCDAQVLVLYDMLGITPGQRPKFSKNFLAGQMSIEDAIKDYVSSVKNGQFPDPEHCFS